MNLNQSLDNFLKKTVWLWLPFFAFFVLLKDVRERWSKR